MGHVGVCDLVASLSGARRGWRGGGGGGRRMCGGVGLKLMSGEGGGRWGAGVGRERGLSLWERSYAGLGDLCLTLMAATSLSKRAGSCLRICAPISISL
jgi:hypothetical protein